MRAAAPAALAALVALSLACDRGERARADEGPAFHGAAVPAPQPVPALRLAAGGGQTFDLADERGKVVLVFFGYTHCPDVCPLTLDRLTRALRTIGRDARDVRVLLVTLDPARDTPAALKAYATRFGPAVVGLTGDSAALARARAGYGAYIADVPAQPATAHAHGGHSDAPAAAAAPAMKTVHSGVVYGIDSRGNLQVVITDGAPLEQVIDDVRTLSRL